MRFCSRSQRCEPDFFLTARPGFQPGAFGSAATTNAAPEPRKRSIRIRRRRWQDGFRLDLLRQFPCRVRGQALYRLQQPDARYSAETPDPIPTAFLQMLCRSGSANEQEVLRGSAPIHEHGRVAKYCLFAGCPCFSRSLFAILAFVGIPDI